MKKLLFAPLFTILFTANHSSYADVIGLRISGGVMDYEVSGTLRDDPSAVNEIDVKTILGWQDDTDSMGYVYIEHPLPVIPNVRLGVTNIVLAGTGNTGSGFTFNGTTFPGATSITSEFDLSHTEVALYYEILDNVVSLDLGLNVKMFDGDISLNAGGGAVTATEKYDGNVPMLYAGVAAVLPLTGLTLEAEVSAISVDDVSFTDWLARVRYNTDFLLGVELGYRSITFDFEDSGANEYVDLDVTGPYLSLNLSF